ncbi:MAG TPA: DUF6282 family protein [Gammaproteobacteria bacterium]|nr:DUF6282 family protein [Gammaproteobacteria bacterium]
MTYTIFNHAAGGPSTTDKLLQGAIDFHHHGYPELSLKATTRTEDVEELKMARAAGMAGIVLKSHMWPTVGRAYLLRELVSGIEILSSITLNYAAGGLNPMSVETAAGLGAKVVFMPTWSAAHDIERGGMSKYLRNFIKRSESLNASAGLTLINEKGILKTEVRECLAAAAENSMVICTGHISPEESIALADGAKAFGIEEVIFSHPDSHSVGAEDGHIRDMVELGAVCEFCCLGCLPKFQRIHPRQFVDMLAHVPANKVILTTDYFFEWAPPAAETLRMLIGTLLELGVPEGDVRSFVRDNPGRLLGWQEGDFARIAERQSQIRECSGTDAE